ncbi:MAG: serine hydrolase [Melioribacteraceae bacterium]|nr:serine hydrolase [Melioribacteraceae bacterium]MCF8265348.1 serine hydrolase [Melioribacteraceae bacterium]MCF8430490.1 serine hydrolase [Melioribacteraceae bacterium]
MKIKKNLYVFLLVGICFATNLAQSTKLDSLDVYITKSMKEWTLPGLSVAIIHNDTVRYLKGFGVKSVNTNDEVDENTNFQLASLSKAFTTTALAMLVEEGKIKWDDPVRKYLPWFEMYDDYVSNQMTIRDLVTHRSGLSTFSGDLLWFGTDYSREEVIKRAKFLEPKFGFREKYGYQNIMFTAAGEIIPAVTGKSWDDFVKERIFTPLGMKTTMTSISQIKNGTNVAYPHQDTFGELIEIPYYNLDNCAPAAGILSNVNELSNWVKLHLNQGVFEGDTLFSKSTSNEMFSNHMHVGNQNYGLGWFLRNRNGKKIVEHGGGMPGIITTVTLIPEENFGIVILSNKITYLVSALKNYIIDLYFEEGNPKDFSAQYLPFYERSQKRIADSDAKMDSMRVEGTSPSYPLEKFTGTFTDEMYGDATISLNDDQLFIQFVPTQSLKGKMSHWHFNTFLLEWEDAFHKPTRGFVRFEMNSLGEIYRMIIDTPHTPDFHFHEFDFRKAGVREFIID